jgi:hypothetical protein
MTLGELLRQLCAQTPLIVMRGRCGFRGSAAMGRRLASARRRLWGRAGIGKTLPAPYRKARRFRFPLLREARRFFPEETPLRRDTAQNFYEALRLPCS